MRSPARHAASQESPLACISVLVARPVSSSWPCTSSRRHMRSPARYASVNHPWGCIRASQVIMLAPAGHAPMTDAMCAALQPTQQLEADIH